MRPWRTLTLIGVLVCTLCSCELQYEYLDEDALPDLAYLNRDVDPCENFYEYTCGNFKNVHPRPDGEEVWDHFMIEQQKLHDLMLEILSSERKPSEPVALQKAKAAFTSCVDVEYTDKLVSAEAEVMKDLGTWPVIDTNRQNVREFTWTKVADIVAKYGVNLFFSFSITPSLTSSSSNAINIFQETVPDVTMVYPRFEKNVNDYLTLNRRSSDRSDQPNPFEAYLRTLAFRLRDLLGTFKTDEEIQRDVRETIDFMITLRSGGIIDSDSKPSSILTIASLQQWTNDTFGELVIDWLEYFTHMLRYIDTEVTPSTQLIYSSTTSFIYGILNLVRQTDHRILWNFIMVQLFTSMAPDSDSVMREAFDTYYTNQGYKVYPRPTYCLRKILGYPSNIYYSMALTYEYQKYHFNVNKLQGAADMFSDLYESFNDILNEADWIDNETRVEAVKKAEQMLVLLGYPDYARDAELLDDFYDDLRTCTWDHSGNSQRTRQFGQNNNFKLIGKPRNRDFWSLSPLEMNAFYNRVGNRILFPVSMLNSFFFSGKISALDYARIGAIIGHEITHGFDRDGKSFNEIGLVSNWWTDQTLQTYDQKKECFINQYNNYYIEEIDRYVDGTLSLNENLADNGGLREAYKAYKKLENRSTQPIKSVGNFTGDQLFFIGFGTLWCMSESNYYLQQTYSNTYAPGRYRVIGSVSNMVEFANAFNCPTGSKMNPEEKCILW